MTNLEQRARKLFPDSEHLQREWVESVTYLRERGLWVLEGGAATWGHGTHTTYQPERRAA